ncbi:MAG: TIM barrel protein [Bacteroidales bacterium]|nr:TIM barrel protein [Bacteroidales bacterium]MBN2698277.1 TIM barrel protein [Bacteroidales bacterium]
MKRAFIIFFIFLIHFTLPGQNSDNGYSEELKAVLEEVERRFDVDLDYRADQVEGMILTNAWYRFRPDLEKTLTNILFPFDLAFKKTGPGSYRIRPYRYSEMTVEDGRELLDFLSVKYTNLEEWKLRKGELKSCMMQSIGLSPMPEPTGTPPIITNRRSYDDYSIENIALETLPGLYVCGSVYKPAGKLKSVPVVLCPNGHFPSGRYYQDIQVRCAMLARMGALVINYDLFAYGESLLQFDPEDHHRSLAMTVQALNSIRILDYLLSLEYADPERVAITGASGGGSQSMLITALDDRIKVSVPVVMLSSFFIGGCPCESGQPLHLCGGGTSNPEIAAMAAPRPQLIISDGGDWTHDVPNTEYCYLQKIYGYYGLDDRVQNAHFPDEGHDYGYSKRMAMYRFLAGYLDLNLAPFEKKDGTVDESGCVIEERSAMLVFGDNGERLPENAIKGFEQLARLFPGSKKDPEKGSCYKISVCDWMILKRQKPGAFERAHQIGADGVEVDMGSLGDRPTFDNKLLDPVTRRDFLDRSHQLGLEISSIAMSGFYAQSFPTRDGIEKIMDDCINTMQLMDVKVAFLPLGVEGDLKKYPERRAAVIERLKMFGQKAEAAGVVIGIETALDAGGEVRLLEEIGSPAIKIYFNFQNPLENGRDLCEELRILGKDRICQFHCTDTDGVLLKDNKRLDMHAVKKTLDEMGWCGWLVIERSRDAKNTGDVIGNYGSNSDYLKSIFSN